MVILKTGPIKLSDPGPYPEFLKQKSNYSHLSAF